MEIRQIWNTSREREWEFRNEDSFRRGYMHGFEAALLALHRVKESGLDDTALDTFYDVGLDRWQMTDRDARVEPPHFWRWTLDRMNRRDDDDEMG